MIVTVYYSIFYHKPNTRIYITDDTNKVVLFWYIFNHLIRKKLSKKLVRKLIEFGKIKGDRRLIYIDQSSNTIYKIDYEIDYNT